MGKLAWSVAAIFAAAFIILILLILFGPPPGNPPEVNMTARYGYIAEGGSVEFSAEVTDEDPSGVSYLWDFGDGATSTVHNTTHTYTDPGVYTVTLKVTDKDGYSTFKSTKIVVEDIIKGEASEMLVSEFDVKRILGFNWSPSEDVKIFSRSDENILSLEDNYFKTPYVDFNSEGTVRGDLNIHTVLTVYILGGNAKGELELHKSMCENENDCIIAEELSGIGDEGYLFIWYPGIGELVNETIGLQELESIPMPQLMFIKKNVVVLMTYGYDVSGSLSEINYTYISYENTLQDLGMSDRSIYALAELQASKIKD